MKKTIVKRIGNKYEVGRKADGTFAVGRWKKKRKNQRKEKSDPKNNPKQELL